MAWGGPEDQDRGLWGSPPQQAPGAVQEGLAVEGGCGTVSGTAQPSAHPGVSREPSPCPGHHQPSQGPRQATVPRRGAGGAFLETAGSSGRLDSGVPQRNLSPAMTPGSDSQTPRQPLEEALSTHSARPVTGPCPHMQGLAQAGPGGGAASAEQGPPEASMQRRNVSMWLSHLASLA